MDYNLNDYIGRKIKLFPNDSYYKSGVIMNIDDLGFIIKLIDVDCREKDYKENDFLFYPHGKLIFTFID